MIRAKQVSNVKKYSVFAGVSKESHQKHIVKRSLHLEFLMHYGGSGESERFLLTIDPVYARYLVKPHLQDTQASWMKPALNSD